MATLINLNDITPVAPANGQNVLWQSDASSPTNVSAYIALGGVNTNVQVKLAGVLYGDSGFTYDGLIVKVAQNSISGIVIPLTSATAAISSFALTAAATAVGGNTTYTGTFNANLTFTGRTVTVSGFTTTANNGIFHLVSITATTMVLNNPSGVSETHAGTAALEFPVTLYAGVVPTVAQGVNFYTMTVAGFANAGNNGTFICYGANASWITIKNSGGILETHAGTGALASAVPAGGNVIIQGNNNSPTYHLQSNVIAPVFNIIGGSSSSALLVLTQEGNPNDSFGMGLFQDPNGSHGFQMWQSGQSSGATPGFFEAGYTGTVNPYGFWALPDETTGLLFSSNAAVPFSGYTSQANLVALSDTQTTGFISLISAVGSTGATGNATLTVDNVNGTSLIQAGLGGIKLDVTAASGNISLNPSGKLVIVGGPIQMSGAAFSIMTKTISYATLITDYTVLVNAAGATTVTLLTTGIPVGKIFQVKNINTGTVTVVGQTGNIDGAANFSIPTQYASATFQWDGSNWWIF